jgi:O-antigen/teichoic acid export membrane protein
MLEFHKNSQIENQKILVSLFSFLLLIHVALIIIFYLVFDWYLYISESSFKAFPIVLIILMSSSFIIGSGFWGIKLKYERQSFKFFLLAASKVLFVSLLSYLFIVKSNMGAVGKFLPGLIIDFLIVLVFYFIAIKNLHIDWKIIKNALKITTPLVISVLLVVPIQSMDIILLERLNNVNEFAMYSIANTIVGYFILLPTSILMVIEPDIFELTGLKMKKRLIIIFIGFCLIIFMFACIYFIFSEYLVNYLTAGKYLGAQTFIGPFLIFRCIDPIIYFLSFILIKLRLTRLGLLNVIFLLFLSFFIYPYFIELYGFLGAIYSKVFIYSLWVIILVIEIYYRNNYYITKFSA